MELRKNQEITASSLFLIDEKGDPLGIVSWDQAMILAYEKGLDLVGVNLKVNPPVCKLMDIGKLKYEQEKQKRKQQKEGKTELKEIKLSFNIDEHDLDVRKRKAVKFLNQGHQVRVTLQMRGREIKFAYKGIEIIENFAKDINGKFEQKPKRMGWRFTAIVRKNSEKQN